MSLAEPEDVDGVGDRSTLERGDPLADGHVASGSPAWLERAVTDLAVPLRLGGGVTSAAGHRDSA